MTEIMMNDIGACDRMSPLHVAVLQDNAELVGMLLQHGAHVDCIDNRGLIDQQNYLPVCLAF